MFASITCPACRHKFIIPEAGMGSRHNCPNCQTPFVAGKSVPEANVAVQSQPAPAPAMAPPSAPAGINKTMLGETEPPVRYNCPRCKKPLESPAIEAGTKKPCPACGQRLQVPAPPPPPPGLNKTLLASAEGNPHSTGISPVASAHAPAAPSSMPMGTVLGAPPQHNHPASGSAKRIAIIAGALGGVFFLLLCTCVLVVLFTGPSAADREKLANAQKEFANAQKELDELKRSIQLREALVTQQKALETEHRAQLDKLMADFKARQERLDSQAERDRQAFLNDQQKAAEAKAAQEKRQRELDDAKLAALQLQQKSETDLKAKLANLESELAAQKQRQQQVTTVVSQPPPVVYYPYYHPYRYWWGY
jgi:hypothetical protein